LTRAELRRALPAPRAHALVSLQLYQGRHRGASPVVLSLRPDALRQPAAGPGEPDHGAHPPAGDHPGARRGGLQQHLAGPEAADDLVGDGTVAARHADHLLLRLVDALADRLGHLVGLAEPDADAAVVVADDGQC